MSSHRLLLSAGAKQLRNLSTRDFLWRPRGERSSMETNIGPRLEELGDVPALHVDFVRLAVLVFLADRSARRNIGSGVRWDRELELTVPVSDPDAWETVAEAMAALLHGLTGDSWQLSFKKARAPKRGKVAKVKPAPVVCLFSGGADSLAGALQAYGEINDEPPVLVSHWDFSAISAVQSRLVSELASLWGTKPVHHQIELTRWKNQVGSGREFPNEQSRRSRSFLFIALGLAVAAVRDAELWVCENGFTSINPPLTAERRATLTTRTTHPAYVDGLPMTLRPLGLKVDIRNPFETMTKGTVLKQVTEDLSPATGANLFSASHSCGKPSWFKGYAQRDHCGLCFGCLIRRGSFIASGIADRTLYIEADLRGTSRWPQFATSTRLKTVQAVRYRLGRGYQTRDILSMALPVRIDVADALALVQAGVEELRPVADGIPT
jgi:hypothetical protein